MSSLISRGGPVDSLKDLISRRGEKLNTSTAENSSYLYMETLSSDISLLECISPSDTKMKALKPVSSCNLRLGNPPEFQPPLSLSFFGDEWVFPSLGWILPCCRREKAINTMEVHQQQGVCSFFWGERDGRFESYTPQESVTDQKSTWWMFIEEARADIGHCLSPLFVITFPSDTVLPWKIENCTAVTEDHCSWKCRTAIMSNL